MKAAESLLKPSDVAERLAIEEETLAAWRSTGRQPLSWVKLGAVVRYRPQDVERFIAERLHVAA